MKNGMTPQLKSSDVDWKNMGSFGSQARAAKRVKTDVDTDTDTDTDETEFVPEPAERPIVVPTPQKQPGTEPTHPGTVPSHCPLEE